MYNLMQKQFSERKKPYEVIVVGLGFMGFGVISALEQIDGIRIPLLITRRPEKALEYLHSKEIKAKISSNPSFIKTLSNEGIIAISDDLSLISKVASDCVFEVTGTVDYGTEVAIKTIESGKDLITMNPELQATVGTELKKLADKKGVVISDVVGDQPGSLTRLVSQAKLMGFEVLLAGNMKRYMDTYATQEKMTEWAKDKGLAVNQTVSFTDGTKQAIEMTLVSNHFGMEILESGMKGPEVETVQEVLQHFDWEKIPKTGIVDYVIGKNLFPGIFIVAKHKDANQQPYLRYLGLGEGPYYVLFEPYHLCHLEVVQTIASVAFYREPTINNGHSPISSTIAVAKRDLKKGEKLSGIGGNSIFGIIEEYEKSQDLLPVGIAENAILKKDIAKDTRIKISDVELPKNAATTLLRLA